LVDEQISCGIQFIESINPECTVNPYILATSAFDRKFGLFLSGAKYPQIALALQARDGGFLISCEKFFD
jgi:hypothetical protein